MLGADQTLNEKQTSKLNENIPTIIAFYENWRIFCWFCAHSQTCQHIRVDLSIRSFHFYEMICLVSQFSRLHIVSFSSITSCARWTKIIQNSLAYPLKRIFRSLCIFVHRIIWISASHHIDIKIRRTMAETRKKNIKWFSSSFIFLSLFFLVY